MRSPTMIAIAIAVAIVIAAGMAACANAATPAQMDAAALQAWASKPWDKAALMHATVEVGKYHGVPVVAEHPCSDVCPQYTVRIIHFQLPAGASCASVGGVEKEVLVPIAITVRSKTFCVPDALVASGQYYGR